MEEKKPVRLVLVTCPPEKAAEIAETLVGERLAACANIVPGLSSVYWWEGKVQKDPESLLLLKTRADLVDRLRERVQAIHPYSVPEVLTFAVAEGLPAYLDWVRQSTVP
ncbi:MAG: divalent-cation tolerance protein CutA [Planctomycetes bacterium]|nr:divalent-cation tolerance protein CutA [Planctomycetota bacterium]